MRELVPQASKNREVRGALAKEAPAEWLERIEVVSLVNGVLTLRVEHPAMREEVRRCSPGWIIPIEGVREVRVQ
ncbi:hypothetical protein H8D30_06415 [bacterium]|nr:hypothetical protein [bacterium]